MTENNKKILILSLIIVILFVLLLVFSLIGVGVGNFNIGSISYLKNQYNLEKKSEGELISTQTKYYELLKKLDTSKTEYSKQKNKYESTSDETIEVIKEATKEEKYNIEYMWITLGNYAKKNNLELVVVEPGGTSSNNANNTSNTTNTTNKNDKTSNSNTSSNTSNTSTNTNTSSPNLKVQIIGNYMAISDFIFEVENDATLRFKLDNISMDYVEGTTIKTSFDVKNITINTQ